VVQNKTYLLIMWCVPEQLVISQTLYNLKKHEKQQ
jgi:hypothetical protein